MRRERDRAGTGHLDARREHVERHSERLERTGIASRIGGNDVEARATPLCFTATQPGVTPSNRGGDDAMTRLACTTARAWSGTAPVATTDHRDSTARACAPLTRLGMDERRDRAAGRYHPVGPWQPERRRARARAFPAPLR